MAEVTAVITVFPDIGLLRLLLSPKTQIMSQNKLCFTLKMPDCCLNLLFLPLDVDSLVVGGFQGGHRKPNLPLGAVARAVHAHAVPKHPLKRTQLNTS